MLQSNEIEQAIKLAKNVANDKGRGVIAIYTYGKGIEIMNENFSIDRNYYHSNEGRKMFFDAIAKVTSDGSVNILHSLK